MFTSSPSDSLWGHKLTCLPFCTRQGWLDFLKISLSRPHSINISWQTAIMEWDNFAFHWHHEKFTQQFIRIPLKMGSCILLCVKASICLFATSGQVGTFSTNDSIRYIMPVHITHMAGVNGWTLRALCKGTHVVTQWVEKKFPKFCRRYFKLQFLAWIFLNCDWKFTYICS